MGEIRGNKERRRKRKEKGQYFLPTFTPKRRYAVKRNK
jgi:hypothetical protein